MGQRIRSSLTGCLAVLGLAAACGGHPTPTPAGGAQADDFGFSVALSASGTTALVGAPLQSAAYVFAEGGRA